MQALATLFSVCEFRLPSLTAAGAVDKRSNCILLGRNFSKLKAPSCHYALVASYQSLGNNARKHILLPHLFYS